MEAGSLTVSESTHPQPQKPTARPTVWRQIAGLFVDLLFSAFIGWVVCFTFGWQTYWTSLSLLLWVGEVFWCRDRLKPTAGEYFLGIRYLTSASSQVVADIKIIHPKLKLNGFILFAGVLELTLSILFFSGWTLLAKSVIGGIIISPPLSLVYWAVYGLGLFACGASFLGGSKNIFWVVPVIHGWFLADFHLSCRVWEGILKTEMTITPGASTALWESLSKVQPPSMLVTFLVWTAFLALVIFFSRKLMVN